MKGKLESERKKLPKKAQQKELISNVVIGPNDEDDPSKPPPPQPKPQERTAVRKKGRK